MSITICDPFVKEFLSRAFLLHQKSPHYLFEGPEDRKRKAETPPEEAQDAEKKQKGEGEWRTYENPVGGEGIFQFLLPASYWKGGKLDVQEWLPYANSTGWEVFYRFCKTREQPVGKESGVSSSHAKDQFAFMASMWDSYFKREDKDTNLAAFVSMPSLLVASTHDPAHSEADIAGFILLYPPDWLRELSPEDLDYMNTVIRKKVYYILNPGRFLNRDPPPSTPLSELIVKVIQARTSIMPGLTQRQAFDLIQEQAKLRGVDLSSLNSVSWRGLLDLVVNWKHDPRRGNEQYLSPGEALLAYEVSLVCVDETRRGQGISQFLFEYAQRKVRLVAQQLNFGDVRFHLYPSTDDVGELYQRMGFRDTPIDRSYAGFEVLESPNLVISPLKLDTSKYSSSSSSLFGLLESL